MEKNFESEDFFEDWTTDLDLDSNLDEDWTKGLDEDLGFDEDWTLESD